MIADLHLDGGSYGLGAGLLFVTYSVLMMPGSMLVEKMGAPTGLAASTVLWGTITALTSLVRSKPAFFAARLALGAQRPAAFQVRYLLFLRVPDILMHMCVCVYEHGRMAQQRPAAVHVCRFLLTDAMQGRLAEWRLAAYKTCDYTAYKTCLQPISSLLSNPLLRVQMYCIAGK